MKEKTKCDFCGCNEGCIGELPGSNGRCMGFFVPKEQAEAYRNFVADQYAVKIIESVLFAMSASESFDCIDVRNLKPLFSHFFMQFLKHFDALSGNKEVSSNE